MIKVYGLKNCDTCRKAVKAFEAKGMAVELVDIRANPLGSDQIEAFKAAFGESLLNTRSTTWRGLSEEERAGDMIELLSTHPALMKRPVVEGNGRLTLGWTKAVQAEWLE